MQSVTYRVVELLLEDGSSPYADWFATLDPVAAAKVTVAKVRIAQGNFSNVEWFRGIGEEGEVSMALTRDFKETVVSRVKSDPAFAQALLDEALTLLLNGDPQTAKLILRDLVNATIGFEALAGDLHKPSKSLHRMLSRAGNPTMENLSAILVAIKKTLRVDIRAVVSPTAA